MSLDQFVADMLNINCDQIEHIHQITKSDNSIVIKVRLRVNNFTCPYCRNKVNIHSYSSRTLTHSIFANRNCSIIYMRRRFSCRSCGITFSESNPFSASGEKLTHETKLNILKDLKKPGETYTLVAQRYNVSVSTVIRTFDKHISITRKHLPEVLSMDEHYFPNSNYDSLYCVLFMNFETGEIIDVLPSRKKIIVTKYFSDIKASTRNLLTLKSELDNVKYVSIDLYENFRDIVKNMLPNAIICADSFHVLKHLTEDFNRVRMRCYRSTENNVLRNLLLNFRFIFRHKINLDQPGKYNRSLGRYATFRQIREILFDNFPELEIAYNLKELYIMYNNSNTNVTAAENFDNIRKSFADSGIDEYDEFVTLLGNWKQEIINSFAIISNRRINNSYIESKNAQVEHLISNAKGFSNFERTRNRIMYCLNKNDTYLF